MKAKKQERKQKFNLWKSKQQHPDWCFCTEDGVWVERDPLSNKVYGELMLTYSFYDIHKERPIYIDVYRCSVCKKRYDPYPVVFA